MPRHRSLVLSALICLLLTPATFADEGAEAKPDSRRSVVQSVRHDTSPPLRDMIAAAAKRAQRDTQGQPPAVNQEIPNVLKPEFLHGKPIVNVPDPLRQAGHGPLSAPPVDMSFDGYDNVDNTVLVGGQVAPPDTNGAVGPDHYIQYVNLGWAIFDKTTGGHVLGSPFAGNTFWAGFGGPCETNNSGDPIVLYDHLADRWVFSQFITTNPGRQCFAVSTTSDPLGPYNLYDFLITGAFGDYPKVGLWTNADGTQSSYTMTTNDFAGPFAGASLYVVERDEMLLGNNPATMVRFAQPPDANGTFFAVQPPHLEGNDVPPAGACATFSQMWDDEQFANVPVGGSDSYVFWQLCADWDTPASSTLTAPTFVSVSEYDAEMCGFGACIPQPGTGNLLDPMGQFTMFRVIHRQHGGDWQFVITHGVDVGGNQAGVRWSHFSHAGGTFPPTLLDEGVYSPDSDNRWVPSAGIDSAGNIGIVYSVSSATTAPSIRFTGRSPGDPAGTLRVESSCVEGGGAQTGTTRWGDYASVSVDPEDGCTFWATTEYIPTNTSFTWVTRVCSFRFASCATDIFTDGFESGDTAAWSSSSPP